MDCACTGCLPSGLVRCTELDASAESWQEGEGTGGWGWAARTGCHHRPQVSVALSMPPHATSLSLGSVSHLLPPNTW